MNYESCFDALKNAGHALALTGAGVSTLAGIPDFRGKNGIFKNQTSFEGYALEQMFYAAFFEEHPEVFYRYANEFWYPLIRNSAPGIAHLTLAELEQKGYIKQLFTQNIDTLHTKGGSRDVQELHGSFQHHYCMRCGKEMPWSAVTQAVESNQLPYCEKCHGLVKPGVIFYGDNLNQALLRHAFKEFERADILLIMGSTLTVQPVASLPLLTLDNGGKLIIVNDGATELDDHATWRFTDIAEFCCEINKFQ
ncbi:MAG: Sir2 family NAD-dependent protein deacetylase [Lentisphaeria bacterium]|nr:Sir2 family NAD-dependent protein deacetylase [Lentisphaeria bacterium]